MKFFLGKESICMLINTVRFGELDVNERQVFTFGEGLPGFATETLFAFLPHDDGSDNKPNFAYLQSLKTPELTFLLADPFAFFPEYEFEIDDVTEADLNTSTQNLPMVWTIVTVLNKIEDMTLNLVAPLLFNVENRRAAQMILNNHRYGTRHRVFADDIIEKISQNSNGGGANAGTQS